MNKRKAPFALINRLADQLDRSVQKMTDKELRQLKRECSRLTFTNCWWVLYLMRWTVRELATVEQTMRRVRKRQKKAKAKRIQEV